MRFRAEVSNHGILTRLVQSIEKLARKCVLRFTPDRVHFICTGSETTGVQVWSQIERESIFSSYLVESRSANEIHLELHIEALQRALKSGTGATEIVIKLTKRGQTPTLQFNIKNASRTGKQLDVVQEVSVKVLKPEEIKTLAEPLCPDPDVHIILPSLLSLKSVIDRMKSISGDLVFSANLSGEMRLTVESDTANVETQWRDLRHPDLDPTASQKSNDQVVDPRAFHRVSLDIRGVTKFLSSHVIAGTVIGCVCADHCAIFYVYIGDPTRPGAEGGGVLVFFVPALKREGD